MVRKTRNTLMIWKSLSVGSIKCFSIFALIFILRPMDLAKQNQILGNDKKGLALTGSQIEDVEKLGAGWWYVYSVWDEQLETAGYVPMLYDGTPDGTLPIDYDGFVLVFNEPSINGIGPEEGAQRYLMLIDLYEDAKFVVGGAIESDPIWAIGFLAQLDEDEKPDRWHVHHYFGHDYLPAIEDIKSFHEIVQTPIWVTEFGSIVADQQATSGFMLFMEITDWIEYYAYFPTRMNQTSGTYWWFPEHWDPEMALVNWDSGELMSMGEIYRDFNITKNFFPLIRSD